MATDNCGVWMGSALEGVADKARDCECKSSLGLLQEEEPSLLFLFVILVSGHENSDFFGKLTHLPGQSINDFWCIC